MACATEVRLRAKRVKGVRVAASCLERACGSRVGLPAERSDERCGQLRNQDRTVRRGSLAILSPWWPAPQVDKKTATAPGRKVHADLCYLLAGQEEVLRCFNTMLSTSLINPTVLCILTIYIHHVSSVITRLYCTSLCILYDTPYRTQTHAHNIQQNDSTNKRKVITTDNDKKSDKYQVCFLKMISQVHNQRTIRRPSHSLRACVDESTISRRVRKISSA